MCGIFGIIAKKDSRVSFDETKKIVDELFILSERRGKESSGIAVKKFHEPGIHVFKQSIPASKLIRRADYKTFLKKSLNGTAEIAPYALIAHARLVTNGSQENNDNNQPVIKEGAVVVHNGIIVNVEELWKKYSFLGRKYEVDTEILVSLIRYRMKEKGDIIQSAISVFDEIYGAASIAMLMNDQKKLLLATNTGSLYWCIDQKQGLILFSSEKYILETAIDELHLEKKSGALKIEWIKPFTGKLIDIEDHSFVEFNLNGNAEKKHISYDCSTGTVVVDEIYNQSPVEKYPSAFINNGDEAKMRGLMEFNVDAISKLKRCSKCLLPETFPFIEYDTAGVCNYCHHYQPIKFKGVDELKKIADETRKTNGEPDCIVTFSGGRDSCYGLHYMKKELNMNPIAYTYDWGMVTDLARRNQARLCGKLGIEHIVISADIIRKRSNIRKNVLAWLKRPHLGTIPLFMAGDKQYFYYANLLKKQYKSDLVVLCENMLETTNFKSGFCGIAPPFKTNDKEHTYHLSSADKIRMVSFYGKEYLANPAYLNSSMIDTVKAFASYYFIPHEYLNLFGYIRWDEKEIEDVLFGEYQWELSPDTTTTWRIGDGTAAFYNYIYYNVAGFSEFDTFRSNQIREGMITREEGLRLVNIENRPRFESFKWYCDTIGIDFNHAVKTINAIPKLYRK